MSYIPEAVRKGVGSGSVGGRGNGGGSLNDTHLGKWLALVRIQSLPVTLIPVCIGYITVAETLLTPSIVGLVAVTSVGHFTFYAMNDLFDYKEDLENKDDSKPLLSDELSYEEAQKGIMALLAFTVGVAGLLFEPFTFMMYATACTLGLIYNTRSKKDWYSGLYLSAWAFPITYTGSLYAGGINRVTVSVAVIVAVQMLIITILGDMKDIDAQEPSIPKRLGYTSSKNTDCMRKDIVKYTILSTLIIAFYFAYVAPVYEVLLICVGSVVWGLTWQKIQFGSAFYFP